MEEILLHSTTASFMESILLFVCFSYQISVCPWTEGLEKMEKTLLCSCSGQFLFFLLLNHSKTVSGSQTFAYVGYVYLYSLYQKSKLKKKVKYLIHFKIAVVNPVHAENACNIFMQNNYIPHQTIQCNEPHYFILFAYFFSVWFNRMQLCFHMSSYIQSVAISDEIQPLKTSTVHS